MSEIKVELIECPKLPTTIQGDGRHVMSMLKAYLEALNNQVNLANGFAAEEINPDSGAYVTPKNFFLSFNRFGGELTWSHLTDMSNFAYYELRTNKNIGKLDGRLEIVTDRNNSKAVPLEYSGTIYLYAVNKDKEYSAPAVINYTKERPSPPKNVSMSITTDNGVLITFSEIPSDCIGAHVFIDGVCYTTLDSSFLYNGSAITGDAVHVSYFDQFGDGGRGTLSINIPDVTGLFVERNGTQLDFYWDAINSYGIKYLVKACPELNWEQGVELFRTATNDKNRRLYPNTGKYYLMVKAYDDAGRYSKNFAWQVMNHTLEIDKNIILNLDQQDTLYSGNKINVYYNPIVEGLTLDRDANSGEYMFPISLPQKYKARNWLEYNAIAVSNSDISWDDFNETTWEGTTLHWAGVIGNIDSSSFKHELAYKKGEEADSVFSVDFNDTLLSVSGATPLIQQQADTFESGRWHKGLKITDLTRLCYDVYVPNVFSVTFWIKTLTRIPDTVFFSMRGSNGSIEFGYNANTKEFYLSDSKGKTIKVKHNFQNIKNYYFIGISQKQNNRALYVYDYNKNKTLTVFGEHPSIGTYNRISCSPQIIL